MPPPSLGAEISFHERKVSFGCSPICNSSCMHAWGSSLLRACRVVWSPLLCPLPTALNHLFPLQVTPLGSNPRMNKLPGISFFFCILLLSLQITTCAQQHHVPNHIPELFMAHNEHEAFFLSLYPTDWHQPLLWITAGDSYELSPSLALLLENTFRSRISAYAPWFCTVVLPHWFLTVFFLLFLVHVVPWW